MTDRCEENEEAWGSRGELRGPLGDSHVSSCQQTGSYEGQGCTHVRTGSRLDQRPCHGRLSVREGERRAGAGGAAGVEQGCGHLWQVRMLEQRNYRAGWEALGAQTGSTWEKRRVAWPETGVGGQERDGRGILDARRRGCVRTCPF